VSQRCASFPRKGNKQQLQGSYPEEGAFLVVCCAIRYFFLLG